MLPLLLTLVLTSPPQAVGRAEALHVRPAAARLRLDGIATSEEYGAPTLALRRDVPVWIVRRGEQVYVAASIPDPTRDWSDDFVVVIDADGKGGTTPMGGDRKWVVRRTADSSVTYRPAYNGRWEAPRGDPKIGAVRGGEGWTLRTHDEAQSWSVELILSASILRGKEGRRARIGLQTFDGGTKEKEKFAAWPAPPVEMPPSRIEMIPDLWAPIVLDR